MKNTEIETRRESEKHIVSQMIALYCRKKHGTQLGGLCGDCSALTEYARMRSDKCPFMETKTFCSGCKVHCYSSEMREKIRAVMRYSGPRMLLYHPVCVIRHIIDTKKEQKRTGKNSYEGKVI